MVGVLPRHACKSEEAAGLPTANWSRRQREGAWPRKEGRVQWMAPPGDGRRTAANMHRNHCYLWTPLRTLRAGLCCNTTRLVFRIGGTGRPQTEPTLPCENTWETLVASPLIFHKYQGWDLSRRDHLRGCVWSWFLQVHWKYS
jgi:hypothetical protein